MKNEILINKRDIRIMLNSKTASLNKLRNEGVLSDQAHFKQ